MEIPWNGHCQQCFNKSISYLMSMYSHMLICGDCKEAETKQEDYQQAVDRDVAEYLQRVEASRGR